MRAALIVVAVLIAALIFAQRGAVSAGSCNDTCETAYTSCNKSCKSSDTNCFTKCLNERGSCLAKCQ